jgi:hypothetical protein
VNPLAPSGQIPEQAEVGVDASNEKPAGRAAYFLANSHYGGDDDLRQTLADAKNMKATTEGRGYRTIDLSQDQTAAEMEADYRRCVGQTRPSEELLLYYAGHGREEGLLGVDYGRDPRKGTMPNAVIADLVDQATSKGIHLTFILDTCHSGAAASLVRRQHRNQLAARTHDTGARQLVDVAARGDALAVFAQSFWIDWQHRSPESVMKVLREAGLTATASLPSGAPTFPVAPEYPYPQGHSDAELLLLRQAYEQKLIEYKRAVAVYEVAAPEFFWRELVAPTLRSWMAALVRAGGQALPVPTGAPNNGQLVALAHQIAEAALRAAERKARETSGDAGSGGQAAP